MSTKSQSSQSLLQISAVVAAFAAVAQAVFGGILASHLAALGLVHATIGTVAILAASLQPAMQARHRQRPAERHGRQFIGIGGRACRLAVHRQHRAAGRDIDDRLRLTQR